jgi:hypothetical protein
VVAHPQRGHVSRLCAHADARSAIIELRSGGPPNAGARLNGSTRRALIYHGGASSVRGTTLARLITPRAALLPTVCSCEQRRPRSIEEHPIPDSVDQQSVQTLFAGALRDSSDLAQKEFELFRTEMSESIRRMFLGLALMVSAAVFAIAALMLLTEALVKWLATVVNSEALAALIVGGVMALVALGLGLYGRSAFSSVSLAPERTIRSVQRDAQVLSERVSK